MDWRIGCSGFSYNDWQGVFYPDDLPHSAWFDYYTTWFDTLELNVTFYRFPTVVFFNNLYRKSPEGFEFVVKAPKEITHIRKFEDVGSNLNEFYSVIKKGLKEKLGAALFQLPPSFQYSEEKLWTIIESMDPEVTNVIEFRHRSWWNNAVIKELGRNNISFCGVSHPSLPDDVIVNTATPYYRFHGSPTLYYSIYDTAFLNEVAEQLSVNKKVSKAFLLFNNTATRAALENATYLREYTDL